MANFSPKEIDLSTINNGERFENGQIPEENAFNDPIEASAYAQQIAKNAIDKADYALQKVNDSIIGEVTLSAYPIGSIYLSVGATEPAELFGGTWEKIKDTFLLASGDLYNLGESGGSADAIVVSHSHNGLTVDGTMLSWASNQIAGGQYSGLTAGNTRPLSTVSTGDSGIGKNMPPYLVVNVWKRVA